MYFIYSLLTNIIVLVSPIILIYRLFIGKEDPKRFKEKFCLYKGTNNSKSIWFHAASVGEMMSIIPVIKKLEKNKNIRKIILTTSTVSSAKIFKKQNFKKTTHKYFPLDVNLINKKFINFWKPKIAVFVDSEIWPNMFKNLEKSKIPIIILNARITKKSFNNWKFFNNFAKEVFNKITLALPQNSETRKFLYMLGVKNIKTAGNIKFYGKSTVNKKQDLLFRKKFKKFKVWCAASTHNGEELLISKLHKKIKKFKKNLLTIIIPRHVNRSEKIINEIKKLDLKIITHSSNKKLNQNTDIYLVDTYGEVSKFFNLSNIAFLGGSIVKRGGQNPLEPARFGNYIINGPHIFNFTEIYAFLRENNISQTCSNIEKMKKEILKRLNNGISYKKKQKIFSIGDKILNKNVSYLTKYIV